ncbi:hypothetical protein CK203_048195 [Vitis vinifera]|uniref:Reverse transcriptase domain-containing protein n=1 Tax=Vitis vinifera TaxID=29760 RepID=A0A438H3S2_VITVI|nr:hypothetical protein CK203_048195 [Vitis vinifera]
MVSYDVYSGLWPTLRRDRESFSEELGAIKGLWNGPWCVVGDFNAILSLEERSRGGNLNSNMRRFLEVIEDLELKDLPMVGDPFTWIGGFETLEPLDASALEIPFMEEEEFYENDKFVKSLNATFVVLIPKKAGAKALGDFRPISLVESLYKWLAKALANRLKKVVGKVVSKAQGAFVEEKAYDNVDWTFILTGDPLSPYLFVIAMEVFSAFLKRAVEGGFLSGCKAKGRSEEGVLISHLLFADDTLVFYKPSQDHLTYLSWLLMWFEAVSGLRINLKKSELIPVGRVENMDDLAWEFGCRLGSLPTTYLGMPLGAPFKSVTVWDGVEERFRRSQTEIREDPKGLPLGWGQFGAKASFSKMRVGVFKGKYEEDRGGWCSREVREAHDMGLWKGIRMDWELVSDRMVFIVGNGGG